MESTIISRTTSSARTRVPAWILAVLIVAVLPPAKDAGAQQDGPLFDDVTAAVGLDFVHWNGMSGELYQPENMGAGAALVDFDNDGDLDLYLVQGNLLGPGKTPADTTFPPRRPPPLRDRLYRNELTVAADGTRTLRFRDVTAASRLEATGYGMGVATGDYDNDGWVDLYLTNLGSNQLWRNLGAGEDGVVTFADVTAAAGVDDGRWSVPAVFFDYDRDGWLDLYVGNYVSFDYESHRRCISEAGERDYCNPLTHRPQPDRLWRNRGDGTFADVTERSGLGAELGSALGAVAADFDGDGWLDLYVANDQTANRLWLNQRAGGDGRVTFRNDALLAGCAVNRDARPEASMGVDAADYDGDGDPDLFMTHLTRETHTLYVNDGRAVFHDRSRESGLANPSWIFTGFGAAFFDYDNDGRLDVATVNGTVYVQPGRDRERDPYPLDQPNQLFHNLGPGAGGVPAFEDVSERAGAAFQTSEVSRGAAFGDVDNDGDVDVVVANNSGPARLLLNRVGQDASWLGLRLVDAAGRRDQLGARVAITLEGGKVLWRRVRTDGSYASASDPRLVVGLGDAKHVAGVRVEWPSGRVEEWSEVSLGTYQTLREGSGRPGS